MIGPASGGADTSTTPTSAFAPPLPLGIGCSYLPSLPEVSQAMLDIVDFVEISPDMLCREIENGPAVGMSFVPQLLEPVLDLGGRIPVVVHGLELSIGSADGWNDAYLDVLQQFLELVPARWHSEHLGFLLATRQDGSRINAGVPLPLPFTSEVVDCVAPRADSIIEQFRLPFLLENAAYYLPDLPADEGWDEVVFLNELVRISSCGLLLDLFNMHCNAVNHGFDLLPALERLRLDRVVEVHVAGGHTESGFLLDAHSATVPPPVWEALEWLLPRAPNIAGVLFEVQEPAFDKVGLSRMRGEIDHLRSLWRKHREDPT